MTGTLIFYRYFYTIYKYCELINCNESHYCEGQHIYIYIHWEHYEFYTTLIMALILHSQAL